MSRAFYGKGLRFECQRSGRCCVFRGEHRYVYVDLDERRELARLLGFHTSAFTRRYCVETDGRVHLKERDGGCTFLDGSSCGVYGARPTQCRTWPFWPENMNEQAWSKEIAPVCAGIGKGRLHSAVEIASLLAEHADEA